jgi:coenzyme PQQ precursor peptide PqqA
MTTAQTAEATQAVRTAEAGKRVWTAPEVQDFETSMEVTAYVGRR